jgi:hypothetical protein
MVLREKLRSIKMTKTKNVATYLTKITQVMDELGVVGEVVVVSELVRTAFNQVTKQWVVFVEGIVARENLPKWDRLWDDFIQEETQKGYVQRVHQMVMMRRMWHLQLKAKRSPRKVPRVGTSRRVK